jgi:hypothetical protein
MFLDRPAAIITGASAMGLSMVLHRPETQAALLSLPAPLRRSPEFAAAVMAVHEAGAAYEAELRNGEANRGELGQGLRRRAGEPDVGDAERRWTSSRAARHLQIGVRRAQQLAASGQLDAELVGGQWMIDPASVRRYSQFREGAA